MSDELDLKRAIMDDKGRGAPVPGPAPRPARKAGSNRAWVWLVGLYICGTLAVPLMIGLGFRYAVTTGWGMETAMRLGMSSVGIPSELYEEYRDLAQGR